MRSHNRIRSTFWGSGETGRALRDRDPSGWARLLALFLFSNDRALADPWGVYHLSVSVAAQELNTTAGKVRDNLATLGEMEFALYDPATEWVWVVNMAAEQVLNEGRPLASRDNMSLAANKWYGRCPRNPWLGPFFDRYVGLLHLEERREGTPSPPLRRRKEDRLDIDVQQPALLTEGEGPPPTLALTVRPASIGDRRVEEFDRFWAAYHAKGKSSRTRTKETWMKRKPPFDKVMEGLERWKASQRWADGFVVDSAKFLNEERWLEEPPKAPMPGASQRTQDVVEALNTEGSMFDLEGMLPGAARGERRLRG